MVLAFLHPGIQVLPDVGVVGGTAILERLLLEVAGGVHGAKKEVEAFFVVSGNDSLRWIVGSQV